jgi:tetratricopeptide (TPR) repeat protein
MVRGLIVLALVTMACVGALAAWRLRMRNSAAVGTPLRHLYFYTILGILLGFGLFTIPISSRLALIFNNFGVPLITAIGLDDAVVKVLIVAALLLMVLYGERRSLASIGIVKPRLSDLGWGIGAFAIGEALIIVTAFLVPHNFSAAAETRYAMFARFPLWLMLLVALVNGIFEEIVARGFAVERLSEVTHSSAAGAIIALAINDAVHIPYWGWRVSLVLLPGLAVFVVLYLWRRSVVPCAIGHILNDAAPALLATVASLSPATISPYLSYNRQGAISYSKCNCDRSIELFSKAIARNPRDSYAYSWRGLAYLNRKDDAKAFTDLSEAIRIDPKSAEAYRHRAFAYETRSDFAHARADVVRALDLDPDDGSSWELRGRLDLHDDQPARAADDYGRAIRLDPTNSHLYERRAAAETAAGAYKLAVLDYRKLLRFDPGDKARWIELAHAYENDGSYEKALDTVAHVFRIDPVEAYTSRADIYESEQKYELAMADINHAIQLDSKRSDLYATRANIRVDLSGALRDYASSIKLEPERFDLYVSRAAVYAAKNDNNAAVADYTRAIALEADASLYEQRGELFMRLHDYKMMNSDWQKALDLDTEDGNINNDIAWTLATNPDSKVRDGKKAVALAQKSCELSGWKDSQTVDTLAAAYAEIGDFKNAIEFENKAIALKKADEPDGDERARLQLYEDHQPYRDSSS